MVEMRINFPSTGPQMYVGPVCIAVPESSLAYIAKQTRLHATARPLDGLSIR
jgi:hypothetical protein